MFKEITHTKNLAFDDVLVEQFLQAISSAEGKGCLLLQFPPGLTTNHISQLDNLLSRVRASNTLNWNVVLEFRNKGWYNEDTYGLLKSYGCTLVIHDIPASATPFVTTSTKCVYVRFHGPTGTYRDSYTDSFLLEYSEHVREWLHEGKAVYVYFNNTMGSAFANLVTLNQFISDTK